ncbi:MAG: hypothetical protein ACXVH4_04045 [Halobacteriota archaeon]
MRSQDFRPLPGVSVNREKYSSGPEDAVHPDCCSGAVLPGWGVYYFRVSDVTAKSFAVQGDPNRYEFYVKHVPLETCKAHSEIHCRDAESGRDANPNRIIRNLFRIHLSRLITEQIKATA